MLELSLPKFEYSLREKNGKLNIYDVVRKKYVALTPEEWVRQHFVHYLKNSKAVPINLINIEGGTRLNHLKKRTDIMVYSNELKPLLLVECKSPYEDLLQHAVFQIERYNQVIQAPFLALTNGLIHYYWKKEKDTTYYHLDDLPMYQNMLFSYP